KCVPCEGGTPPLSEAEVLKYLKEVPQWVSEGDKIYREFKFVNFKQTMDFVKQVADIAEEEGHHPDMYVSYGSCKVILWTHAINGLSENDFILASKIDTL
ncbi:MAG: 4a-hydroxytetrahydrobiopterin dehydratase, partial [Bacteroidales bacterium]|nr:4a-hydroxytetrahydrobiopterin dehydratase [Bacteroidales bacterium]